MAVIYFSGSISGGRGDVDLYIHFVEALQRNGHRVLAGNVTAREIDHSGESGTPRSIFERDMKWLREAAAAGGLLVAEVSTPSHGVGYEIATARYLHEMPVICLYRRREGGRCSAMIAGDPGIHFLEYEATDLESAVSELLRKVGQIRE